eukprot:4968485-Amphidinium_carterae.1
MARKDANTSTVAQKAIQILAEQLDCCTHDKKRSAEVAFKIQALLEGLHGHVHTALEHPHANYVVQKAVELLPTEFVVFIISELRSKALPKPPGNSSKTSTQLPANQAMSSPCILIHPFLKIPRPFGELL